MWRRPPFLALLLVLFALFVVTDLRGVDFGLHWDEGPLQLTPVRNMVASGVFLPHEYTYPALNKWLALLPAWPGVVATAAKTGFDSAQMQAGMKADVDAASYLLAARKVFIVVSALAILWVYGAVFVLRRKHWAAFFAACCMGLSWEFAYHARWVASDCIVTQFAALQLLLLALFHTQRRTLWLYLAAVVAGLAIGAKQTAVFMLFPAFFSSVVEPPPLGRLRHAGRLVALFALASLAFVVTTPGAVLEPFAFIRDGRGISAIYAAGHGGFSAHSSLHHWGLILTFLSVSFFSPSKIVSIAVFASAVLGGVVWVRRDWRFGVVLLLLPATFLSFFCAKYVVMIARNYLVLTPLLCVMAARGLEEIVDRLTWPWARQLLAGVLGVAALAQAVWLIRAGESIRHVDPNQQVRDAIAYVADHPAKRYRLSEKVRQNAAAQHLTLPSNVTGPPEGDAVVFFALAEIGDSGKAIENDPWLTDAVFGSREVNINWYAVWNGPDHVLVMPIEKARLSNPVAQ